MKIGSKPVRIISLEKNIARPDSVVAFLIKPSLESLLNFSIPTRCASSSRATKIPSTMTTAPSIIIPKSTAPNDSKFAFIPLSLKQIKAKSRDSGIISETISVVRQSAIKTNTIRVTRIIPSARLCNTVCVA